MRPISPSHSAENVRENETVKPLQNRPGDVPVGKLETHEKAFFADSLAIDHLTPHGDFPLHGSNLGLLARLPEASGMHANAMPTDIVRVRSFPSFATRAPYGGEIHLHHDGESSFFPAAEAATIRFHAVCAFAKHAGP
jgi:hypothetical protein